MKKPVPGFPGYLINKQGEIWSSRIKGEWKRLRPGSNKHGHQSVILCGGPGNKTKQYIHRLVLEAFVGPCPVGMECRHLDGNPTNNRLENLCWGTHAENMADRNSHGTSNAGEKNGQSKLSYAQAFDLRRRYADEEITQYELAKEYGINQACVSRIIAEKAYSTSHPAFTAQARSAKEAAVECS